tara:strand:+ start:116 stop:1141 length:1026 start_codon:yes stop_codon:yes gene_type:complete
MSFFKHKVLFRCDAANIPELGTGHLYRCITIAKLLKKKFRLKNNKIAFLIKSTKKYKKGIDILKSYKFRIIKISNGNIKPNSSNEIRYFTNNSSNLLIIDRMGKINNNFFNAIKNSFKKKIILDDSSLTRKYFDLSLNPLVHNVPKFKNAHIGFDYHILPSFFFDKKIKVRRNNIFVLFGGYDKKNLTKRIVKILNFNPNRINIFLHKSFKKNFKNIISKNNLFFFDNHSYLTRLKSSNIAITAGGIGLFDGIFLNKRIICIPQYKHQEINANKIPVKRVINLINTKDKSFAESFIKLFIKMYQSKKKQKKLTSLQKRVVNSKKIKKTLKLIFNLYDKSKY